MKYEAGNGKQKAPDPKEVNSICSILNEAAYQLLDALDDLSRPFLHELSLLTLGSQFQGSYNNIIGNKAAQKLFEIIARVIKARVKLESYDEHVIQLTNSSGRRVIIRLASDPDVLITEQLKTRIRHILAIEIKGGSDMANIHNRLGEAEKTHIKYKHLFPEVQWTKSLIMVLRLRNLSKNWWH